MARTSKSSTLPTASDQDAQLPTEAPIRDESGEALEQPAQPAPLTPVDPLAHAEGLVAAARDAVCASVVTRESLPRLRQLREDVLALLGALDFAADKGKALLAEEAEAVVILEPRQFSVPGRGNIMHATGQRIERKQQPAQFAAIVAQLQHGKHFTFA